jgi:hypothetical protein
MLRPADSTVRFVAPEEVRPDLIFARGKRGPWHAIEVQRRIDRRKGDRWTLLVSVLRNQRGRMGDLWVITASRRTAAWARAACDAAGPNGTRMHMKPIVLLLGRQEVEALLDGGRPSLAFFAAWAMQDRYGPAAAEVVERAMQITDGLPDAALRAAQRGDIMGVLNRRMVRRLKETIMDEKRRIESRWVRELAQELAVLEKPKFVAEGRAEGKREALLLVLEGRGLSMTRAQRATILGCEDAATLNRWIAGAGKAASVRELLAEGPSSRKNGARSATARRNGATKHHGARAG